MDTPIVRLTEEELKSVYDPSEDSFLLIDAIEFDFEKQFKYHKPTICLEIGVGSGVIITALAMALRKYCFSYFLASDINPNACRVTRKTSITNKVNIEIIQMDLLSNLCNKDIFDVIIFNPPYVVTEPTDILNDKLINKTWAGGCRGREVMDRIFPYIPLLLSATGVFYLLVIKENEPDDIIKCFKDYNMIGLVIAERKIRGEHLYVLRFKKM